MKVVLSIAFLIGDQKSNDLAAGRKPVTKGAGRIHRSCMTSFEHANKSDRICQWAKREIIVKLTNIALSPKSDAFMVLFDHQFPDIHGWKGSRKKALKYLKRRADLAYKVLGKVYSSYAIHNAFEKVCFGDNSNGVYRSSLEDTMHFGESGFFNYIIKTI